MSMSPEIPKIALTIDEAAYAVGVSPSQLEKWTKDGSLPVSRLSERCPRIDVDELKAFVKRKKENKEVDIGQRN
jgi:excisionase family DNA binding protein